MTFKEYRKLLWSLDKVIYKPSFDNSITVRVLDIGIIYNWIDKKSSDNDEVEDPLNQFELLVEFADGSAKWISGFEVEVPADEKYNVLRN